MTITTLSKYQSSTGILHTLLTLERKLWKVGKRTNTFSPIWSLNFSFWIEVVYTLSGLGKQLTWASLRMDQSFPRTQASSINSFSLSSTRLINLLSREGRRSETNNFIEIAQGKKLSHLSCPAVSQICNFIFFPPETIIKSKAFIRADVSATPVNSCSASAGKLDRKLNQMKRISDWF